MALQVKTFLLPAAENEANDFLKAHRPMGEIARMGDLLFVAYDDGTYPVELEIADMQEMLRNNQQTRIQHEIALKVMNLELSKVRPDKQRYGQILTGIKHTEEVMQAEETKAAYVRERIATLQSHGRDNTDTKEAVSA